MNLRKKFSNTALAGAVMLLVCAIIAGLLWWSSGTKVEVENLPATKSCVNTDVARELMLKAGFTADQFVVGEEQFNLSLPGARDAGSGVFAKPITSNAKLSAVLNGTGKASTLIVKAAKTSTHARVAAIKNVNNWVGVQMLVPTKWKGNTIFFRGTVRNVGARMSSKGDIGWIFVNPAACINGHIDIAKATFFLRGTCGNPQTTPPIPVNACVKPAPPGSTKFYVYHAKNCTWHKKPQTKNCMLNGGPKCPPNKAVQPVQDNPGQPVGPTPGVSASTEPTPAPTSTSSTAPANNDGGYNSGGQASGPSPSASPSTNPSAMPTGYATGMPAG